MLTEMSRMMNTPRNTVQIHAASAQGGLVTPGLPTMRETPVVAYTQALQRALARMPAAEVAKDWLFLEGWERSPTMAMAFALRVNQIRRANPELAAEIRAEIANGRPLTDEERASLRKQKSPSC
ncbi:Hypothetical protein GbCGDNIH6_0065 [Granulibacter bethesdensis]|nr:Hypothetical protein GbCGDNIH6_0065 [Granulibacter bethesdensis]